MNGSDAGPEIRINAPAALALVIAPHLATWVPRRGTVCARAEGVPDEYLGGGWFPL